MSLNFINKASDSFFKNPPDEQVQFIQQVNSKVVDSHVLVRQQETVGKAADEAFHSLRLIQQPKSLLERAWQQIKAFFSATQQKIAHLFSSIFGKSGVDTQSHSTSSERVFAASQKTQQKAEETQLLLQEKAKLVAQMIDNLSMEMDQLSPPLEVLKNFLIQSEEDVIGFLSLVTEIDSTLKKLQGKIDVVDEEIRLTHSSADPFDIYEEVKASLVDSFQANIASFKQTVQFKVIDNQDIFIDFAQNKNSGWGVSELRSLCQNLLDIYWEDVFFDISEHEVSKAPIGIPNFSNSCYRISSNQALLACAPLVHLIRTPIIKKEIDRKNYSNDRVFEQDRQKNEGDFIERIKIQKALIALFDCLESGGSPSEILQTERNFGCAMFNSGLHVEFAASGQYGQHDAAAYLQFILADVFDYQHMEQPVNSGQALLSSSLSEVPMEENSTVREENGVVTVTKKLPGAPVPLITVPLIENETRLQYLVDAVYSKTVEGGWRDDDGWRYADAISFKSYTRQVQIANEPKEALVIQFKRGIVNTEGYFLGAGIDKRRLKIPDNGILDFSAAHGLSKGSLLYQVKSFIRLHAESGDFGHYTSYVNKNGEWYHCNDSVVTRVSDKKAKREMALAYVLCLEKLSFPSMSFSSFAKGC